MATLAEGDVTLLGYASSKYRKTLAQTSAPSSLIVALHDAALGCLQQARDIGSSSALLRAHELIAELQLGLDPNGAEELCGELSGLYDFMLQRITHAFVQRELSGLEAVQESLRELRTTWSELGASG